MSKNSHLIKSVEINSPAYECGICQGDILVSINGKEIEDIFDYQYQVQDEELTLIVKRADEQLEFNIIKEYSEDLGIEFDNGLMDDYRSCHNKCIFCFIDQMPKGMRETLYFKDDDSRLSFLQGNYVTLTNMSEHDIERIITYHLEPINVSFQTTNPELRCMMLNNRFAGDALKKVDRLYEGHITMNGQIVLCKNINDGAELERSINDLMKYAPTLQSVSVVPVGLSKYREGLYPLEPFDSDDAERTIDLIEKYQKICYEKFGLHFIHASDEFYLLCNRELPEKERYDGYLQLENGVGMLRLLMDEVEECLSKEKLRLKLHNKKETIGIVTGRLAGPYIKEICKRICEIGTKKTINVYEIRNDFFGERITVSGLLTAQDIIAQMKDKTGNKRLLFPENVLRSGEEVFLDDMSLTDVRNALQVPIDIVKSSGCDFVHSIFGIKK